MDLDRRKYQFLRNLRVLDGHRLVQALALDPFSHQRRRRNRRPAAVGLELGIFNDALFIDFDLQFHDVTAGRRTDHAGANTVVVLIERTDVARIFVMIEYFFAICHFRAPKLNALPLMCCPLHRIQVDAVFEHIPKRRHFTQFLDFRLQQFNRKPNILLSRKPANRKANRAVR